MIRHFLRLGFRNLYKNKNNTLVNLTGLSLGIGILLVISIYANNELSVDSFHENSAQIYKLTQGKSSGTPGPLEELLESNFPDIQAACHIETRQLLALSPILSYEENIFHIQAYYSANADVFNVFDFQVVQGDVAKALSKPFSLILTESEASRIFGDEDPLGQSIIWRSNQDFTFTVEAIVKDVPQNSSIQFKGLISEASTKKMTPYYPDNWNIGVYETYLLLNPEIAPASLEVKLRSFLISYYEENLSSSTFHDEARENPLTLHTLKEVYFNRDLLYDTTNRGNILLVRILIIIGIIILLLSIINYANLSTAKASIRKKEIAIQKVYGSGKTQLILQYLTETILISFMAAVIGVIIALILLPWFSQFINLTQDLKIPPFFLVLLIPFILILGILAGIYPSFFLSSFKEMSMLKAGSERQKKGTNLRHFLVVFQFFISITLIALTLLIDKQVSHLKNMDLGIDKEYVVTTRLPRILFRGKKEVLTDRILRLPTVESVAYSSNVFGNADGYNYLEMEESSSDLTTLWVDAAFLDLYDLELVEGRFFSEELKADMNTTALLNEAAVRALDVEDPFRVEIKVPGGSAKGVGIVKDFHYKSLHHEIEPLAIIYLPGQGAYANMKISGYDIPNTLNAISEIWEELAPGFPFNYQFLDASFDNLYQSDAKMGKAVTLSSLIAIIIAVLGVMSLSLFLCESKVKEIALRKINGAKVWEVLLGLNKGILFNLVIAFCLACPVAWYIMGLWLDNFAYKTVISPWIFLLSGVIVSLITFGIVNWQTWRFANQNPAEALKYE
jgi:putative ABC transport system permease protein